MSINSIKFITSASATATNGSKTITVTGSVDCRNIYSGSAVFLGTRQVVEAVAGTAPDTSGVSTITLRNNWLDPNTTGRLVVFNSIEGLAEAIRRAREITKASELIAGELNPLAELETLGFIERTGPAEWQTFQATALGKALLAAETAEQARQVLGLGSMATATAGTEDNQYRNNSQNDARFAQLVNIQTNAQRKMLEDIKAKASYIADFVRQDYRLWESPYGQTAKKITDVITSNRNSFGSVNTPFGVQAREPNIIRLEYDAATGAALGLLCEDQRNNLALDNEIINAGTGTTLVSSNAVIAPNGTLTADIIGEAATNGEHFAQDRNILFTTGQIYTWSCYVKRISGTNSSFLLRTAGNGSNSKLFNIDGPDFTDPIGGMISLRNGWKRCWMVLGAAPTTGSAVCRLQFARSNIGNIYNGDPSEQFAFWRPQLEPGTLPSSTIFTENTQSTRFRDSNEFAAGSVWPGGAGAIYVKFRVPKLAVPARDQVVFGFSAGTLERYLIELSAAGTLRARNVENSDGVRDVTVALGAVGEYIDQIVTVAASTNGKTLKATVNGNPVMSASIRRMGAGSHLLYGSRFSLDVAQHTLIQEGMLFPFDISGSELIELCKQ